VFSACYYDGVIQPTIARSPAGVGWEVAASLCSTPRHGVRDGIGRAGFGTAAGAIRTAFAEGDGKAMTADVPDEMIDTLAPASMPKQVGERAASLRRRSGPRHRLPAFYRVSAWPCEELEDGLMEHAVPEERSDTDEETNT
jgi:hypothetical protein